MVEEIYRCTERTGHDVVTGPLENARRAMTIGAALGGWLLALDWPPAALAGSAGIVALVGAGWQYRNLRRHRHHEQAGRPCPQ